jgi:hypothetical protein
VPLPLDGLHETLTDGGCVFDAAVVAIIGADAGTQSFALAGFAPTSTPVLRMDNVEDTTKTDSSKRNLELFLAIAIIFLPSRVC